MDIEVKRKYWSNGSLKSEDQYINGQKNGICKMWNKNVSLYFEYKFSRGWNNSSALHYEKDFVGSFKFIQHFRNNRQHGIEIRFEY